MTTIEQAIANRNSAPCNIVVIGDSITEGTGATAFTNGWIQKANVAIRALYPSEGAGTGGGLGFIPIQLTNNGDGLFADPITLTGAATNGDVGPVRFCSFAEDYGTTWTWTAPVGTTSVQILYFDAPVSATWTYQVGSGSVTTIVNTETTQELLTASIPMTSGDVLTITFTDGTVLLLDGIIHYAGDEDNGVTFHGCGHFGWNSSSDASGWMQSEVYDFDWIQAYSKLNPSAIAIMLGVNDAVTTAGNFTTAEFQANLQALADAVLAEPTLSPTIPLVFIAEYEVDETFNDVGGWPAYVAVIESVASGITGSKFIDLSAVMPSVVSAPDDYYDQEHPNDTGHALLAGYVVDAFAPAAPAGMLMSGIA